jgi:sugar/nucleoside kinase (ribokinase family)
VALPFLLLPPRARPFDVAGFGLNSIDLVAVVAEFPEGNTKHRLERFEWLAGGQIATAMAVCARLGWKARYVGSFGGDDLGRLSRDTLIAEGVDLTASRTVAGATNQFAIVLVSARNGDRTVLWNRHPDLATPPGAVPRDAAVSGRILIVDCHETAAATEAARHARAAGCLTIVDVEQVRPGIEALLREIDVIIAAEAFPSTFTGVADYGQALEALAREFTAPVVCMTLGAEGSLTRSAGREIRTRGFEVHCVDSTGAGDAFRGGFAAGCLRAPHASLEDVLTYANAVAALNCRGLGARGGMPTAAEVERLVYARS